MQSGRTSPRPRERIVSTARDLFHRRGIRAVGIDTIAEVAGPHKTTPYRHFTSKDDFIMEGLRSPAAGTRQTLAGVAASSPEKRPSTRRILLQPRANSPPHQ